MSKILLLPILIPSFFALAVFVCPKVLKGLKEVLAFFAATLNLAVAISLFGKVMHYSHAWLGQGIEFSLRLYNFSAFIILAVAGFGFLITLYSLVFVKGKDYSRQFYAYLLISLALVNGAVLADNLLVLLFFWEGLLMTVFGMIYIGGREAFKTATKALIIVGVTDLCMMLGIALTGHLAGTLQISRISLPLDMLGSWAFVLLMIGAISKAGSMPFHSWIPDAALDAPLPFMAFLPAALEKLLGIYFLARISLDMFKLVPDSGMSILLMTIGVITILLAVMMALIQKDYKKLLSYHAISQVGYMILGIGTMVPAGIVGGIFHMINHAMYKSGLFLSGGSVENQAGTTDLNKLGGLAKKMPVTFGCFFVCAAAISGVPPFNGFFSKELVYDGALERGIIFYVLAVAGSFLTAASFLKLGHAAYFGTLSRENGKVKEAPLAMLIPMMVIAGMCILFGVYNALPLNHLIQPAVGAHIEGRSFAGWPANAAIVAVSIAVLAAALFNHMLGVNLGGSGLKAADHIHHAPGLSWTYEKAERGLFDPYNIGAVLTGWFAKVCWWVDRAVDWIYNRAAVGLAWVLSGGIIKAQPVNYPGYLAWALAGMVLVAFFLIRSVIGG